MNVFHHAMRGVWIVNVMVLTGTSLPKATIRPVRVLYSQPIQEWRTTRGEIRDGTLCHRALNVGKDSGHLRIAAARVDQQTNVFRHDDPCPQIEAMLSASVGYRFDKPFSRAIFA